MQLSLLVHSHLSNRASSWYSLVWDKQRGRNNGKGNSQLRGLLQRQPSGRQSFLKQPSRLVYAERRDRTSWSIRKTIWSNQRHLDVTRSSQGAVATVPGRVLQVDCVDIRLSSYRLPSRFSLTRRQRWVLGATSSASGSKCGGRR